MCFLTVIAQLLPQRAPVSQVAERCISFLVAVRSLDAHDNVVFSSGQRCSALIRA